MKFILSFLLTTAILSAGTSFKLSVGNAALNDNSLLSPVSALNPPASIQCTPTLPIPTTTTIQISLPTVAQCNPPVVAKCTPAPPSCNPTLEPASYALLGAGLVTAGVARKFRTK